MIDHTAQIITVFGTLAGFVLGAMWVYWLMDKE